LDVKQLITQIIEEDLTTSDCFLVNIRSNERGTDMRFFIDGQNGVGIQTCARLSRKVSRILDEEYEDETPIRYEISSPGVDEPLVDKRQYPQHIGRELEIALAEDKTSTGELISVGEDSIEIAVSISKHKKKKQTLAFDDIIKSTVIISFKRKKK
jgi:ribosome maturation factor RimP